LHTHGQRCAAIFASDGTDGRHTHAEELVALGVATRSRLKEALLLLDVVCNGVHPQCRLQARR
jgi:hypothetical protein